MSQSARRQILEAGVRQTGFLWLPLVLPGRILAWAAVLLVLLIPALLMKVPVKGGGSGSAREDLNLQVQLQADGAVVLRWDDGDSLHTVRRATSVKDLTRVGGLKVRGNSYLDASSPQAEIVYYQVD